MPAFRAKPPCYGPAMPLRIAVFGQAPFGRDVCVRLAQAGHELVGVHVPPDGGGRADPLAEEAQARGWPLFRYKGYRRAGRAIEERVAEYRALGADLNVLPFTTVILPPEIADHPRHRSVCFHPSILPAYRGGSALAWQIIEGASESGISVFQPDAGRRHGSPLPPAPRHRDRALGHGGLALLRQALRARGRRDGRDRRSDRRRNGAPHAAVRARARASSGCSTTRRRASISTARRRALDRRIRGCDPQPGAWARSGNEVVRLYGSALERGAKATGASPGTITAIESVGPRAGGPGRLASDRQGPSRGLEASGPRIGPEGRRSARLKRVAAGPSSGPTPSDTRASSDSCGAGAGSCASRARFSPAIPLICAP